MDMRTLSDCLYMISNGLKSLAQGVRRELVEASLAPWSGKPAFRLRLGAIHVFSSSLEAVEFS